MPRLVCKLQFRGDVPGKGSLNGRCSAV